MEKKQAKKKMAEKDEDIPMNEDAVDRLVAGGLQETMDVEYPEEPQEEEEFKDAIVEAAPTPDRPDDYIDEDQLKKLELEYTPEHKQKLKEEAEDLKLKGNEYFRLGEYKESALKYTDALRMCPTGFTKDRAVLYANRAAAKMKMGLNESAIEDCSKAIEYDGEYAKALMRRVQLYEKMEKLDEALEDYKKALELDPSNKKAHHALQKLFQKLKEKAEDLKLKGNEYFRLGEYKESALKYTDALRMCPTGFAKGRAVLYANRAAAEMKMGLNESAIEDCSKAIECDGDYVKALMRRAQLYEKTEKLDEALEDYKKVLELDPSNKEAYRALQMDILGKLPVEITKEILCYLTPKELFCCYRVSKRWRTLVNNEHLWLSILPYAACFPSASDFTECDIVGMEVCPTMRKWLADLVAMKRWNENKPKRTVVEARHKCRPYTIYIHHYLNSGFVWMPSPRRSGPGDVVKLDYVIPVELQKLQAYLAYEGSLVGSEDGLFLASIAGNLVFLYSRPTSNSLDFHLQEVLVYNQPSRRNNDPVNIQAVISIWKNEPSGKSLEEFISERTFLTMYCEGFAGTDDDRTIILFDTELECLLIWNISTSRVAGYFRAVCMRKVQAGWNGRGLCISLDDCVICCDYEGRTEDKFTLIDECNYVDTLLMKSVSVVLVAVTIYNPDSHREEFVLMEFERGQRSARIGFKVEEFSSVLTVRLLDGPAYPVVYVSTKGSIQVCIGLASPRGAYKWLRNTVRNYPGIEFTAQCMHMVQFVDGTSFILPFDGRILKVILRKDKYSDELTPYVIVQDRATEILSRMCPIVWADSTRLVLQDENRLIIKAFI